jgi:isoleucyl-tRNA synthetase
MAAARRVVELGRAARNAAAVKTRQPLAEVVVALPEAERRAVEALREVVLDELNVRALRCVADESEMVAYTVKPDLKVPGRGWANSSARCRRRSRTWTPPPWSPSSGRPEQ